MTLANSEITHVRAELEGAAFESAVPPRSAVRLLHMLALALAHKFGGGGGGGSSSKRLQRLNKVCGVRSMWCSIVAGGGGVVLSGAGRVGASPLVCRYCCCCQLLLLCGVHS
jgi:hypothetical protein